MRSVGLLLAILCVTECSVRADRSKFDASVGVGAMGGYTTYEIGGDVTWADGERQTVHFPVSSLEFPLNVGMATVKGSVEFAGRVRIELELQKSITSDAGTMKDSDYGVYSQRASTVDVYSESDTELDALITDISLRWAFLRKSIWGLSAGLGHMHQDFEFQCRDVEQWYPSQPWLSHVNGEGIGLTYDTACDIFYFEFAGTIHLRKFHLAPDVRIGFVTVKDEDMHLARTPVKRARGEYTGAATGLSLVARYDLGQVWFVKAETGLTHIFAEGEQDTDQLSGDGSDLYEFSHTIEAETESSQVSALLSVGATF